MCTGDEVWLLEVGGTSDIETGFGEVNVCGLFGFGTGIEVEAGAR